MEAMRDLVINNRMKNCNLKLQGRIESLQKTNSRLEVCRKDIDTLGKYKYPPGIKSYRPWFETPLLDAMALEEAFIVNIVVEQSTSIRDAKENIYKESARATKELDAKLLQQQREHLRTQTSRRDFQEECLEFREQLMPPKVMNWDLLDLDLEGLEFPNDFDIDTVKAKAGILYFKALDIAAGQKAAQKDEEEKYVANKYNWLEEMVSCTPSELFKKAVDERVRSTMQKIKFGKQKVTATGHEPPGLETRVFLTAAAAASTTPTVAKDLEQEGLKKDIMT